MNRRAVWCLAMIVMVIACGGGSDDTSTTGRDAVTGGVKVSTGTNDSTALADADVRITSTDGALTLAVLRDSVVMQLSDSLRQSVKKTVDSSTRAEAGDGMGAAFANVVGSAVQAAVSSAMGIAVRVPAANVTDLRYEGGRLYFRFEGDKVKISSKGDGKSDGAPFTEADAKKFIDAVEKAKARKIAM